MRPLSETPRRSVRRRKSSDLAIKAFAWIAAWLGIGLMAWIIVVVVKRGIGAWDWDFFTQLPTPVGEPGGGVANAIVGTLIMTVMATALGVPAGFFAGVYLAEFGRHGRFPAMMRGITNVMMLPAPMWFNVVDLVFAYIPAAWLGQKLAGRPAPPVPDAA